MPRPKGSVNKKKEDFRQRLLSYMHTKAVDPHYYMVDLIADTTTKIVVIGHGEWAAAMEVPTVSVEHKLQAAKELAQYLEPKLRSVEVGSDAGNPLRVMIEMVSYADTEGETSSSV